MLQNHEFLQLNIRKFIFLILKIKHLYIKNYKSIQELNFDFTEFVPFIGKNNVGKSNILSAINYFLQEPPVIKFNDDDFHLNERSLEIRITFDKLDSDIQECCKDYVNNDKITITLKGEKDNNVIRYYNKDKKNSINSGTWGKLLKILPTLVYVDAEEILKETSKVKIKNPFGTLIHTLLKPIYYKIYESEINKLTNSDKTRNALKIMDDKLNAELSNYTSEIKIESKISPPTLEDILKNTDLCFKDVQKNTMYDTGVGFHRLIILTILKVANEIKNKTSESLILLMDEPEIFLHPTLQFHMYEELEELSKTSQILFSTHSSNFIKNDKLGQTFRITKLNNITCENHCKNICNYETTFRVTNASDGLFANKVILVEGATEFKTLPRLYRKKFDKTLFLDEMMIIDCGGVCNILNTCNLFKEFGIESYIIIDRDCKSENEFRSENKKLLEELNISNQTGTLDTSNTIIDNNYAVLAKSYDTLLQNSLNEDSPSSEHLENKSTNKKIRAALLITDKIIDDKYTISKHLDQLLNKLSSFKDQP